MVWSKKILPIFCLVFTVTCRRRSLFTATNKPRIPCDWSNKPSAKTPNNTTCLTVIRKVDVYNHYASTNCSYEDVANYCKHIHQGGYIANDLYKYDMPAVEGEGVRILLGFRLGFSSGTRSESNRNDTQSILQYTMPLIDSNNSIHSHTILAFLTETDEGFISFDSSYKKFLLDDAVNTMELLQSGTMPTLCVRLADCNSIDSWDYSVCVNLLSNLCYYPLSKKCVWSPTKRRCYWQFEDHWVLEDQLPPGAPCIDKMDETPCECTKCTYTEWNPWITFTDTQGHTLTIRYRPMDHISKWNCSVISSVCCAEFTFISPPIPSVMNDQDALSLVQCTNGGHKDAKTKKCKCPRGTNGLFCETDFDECENHKCQNGATCRDFLNGYECICPSGYRGEYCTEKSNTRLYLTLGIVLLPCVMIILILIIYLSVTGDQADMHYTSATASSRRTQRNRVSRAKKNKKSRKLTSPESLRSHDQLLRSGLTKEKQLEMMSQRLQAQQRPTAGTARAQPKGMARQPIPVSNDPRTGKDHKTANHDQNYLRVKPANPVQNSNMTTPNTHDRPSDNNGTRINRVPLPQTPIQNQRAITKPNPMYGQGTRKASETNSKSTDSNKTSRDDNEEAKNPLSDSARTISNRDPLQDKNANQFSQEHRPGPNTDAAKY